MTHADAALITALAALRLALRAGGMLRHNESRALVSTAGEEVGLPVTGVRTVMFTQPSSSGPPVYDSVWTHEG